MTMLHHLPPLACEYHMTITDEGILCISPTARREFLDWREITDISTQTIEKGYSKCCALFVKARGTLFVSVFCCF
ncbi:MAG: hypothetical protein HY774_05350 [Acidobacteria bacterium]|nr:hypothetical protein [Acidobacteriota bacterium]